MFKMHFQGSMSPAGQKISLRFQGFKMFLIFLPTSLVVQMRNYMDSSPSLWVLIKSSKNCCIFMKLQNNCLVDYVKFGRRVQGNRKRLPYFRGGIGGGMDILTTTCLSFAHYLVQMSSLYLKIYTEVDSPF